MEGNESRLIRRPALARAVAGLLAGSFLVALTIVLTACAAGARGDDPEAAKAAIATPTLPVVVEGGRVSGVEDGKLHVFRGIPYAAPPVGARRWRPPRPVIPWAGVKECSAFGPSCPQSGAPVGGGSLQASRARVAWYTGADWAPLAAQFPAADYGGLLPATSRMMTVLEFNAPARYAARLAALQGVPAYLYYFSRVQPGDTSGADHSAEIPYVFDSVRAPGGGPAAAADRELADRMAHYWATFAATGSPNARGLPHWPRYDPVADVLLRLDAPLEAGEAPYPHACAVAEKANDDH